VNRVPSYLAGLKNKDLLVKLALPLNLFRASESLLLEQTTPFLTKDKNIYPIKAN